MNVTSATYMPALNRAGWYKYLFMDLVHHAEQLDKVLNTLCADTYNPKILNQPDLEKRDKNEPPGVVARAEAICTAAINRVYQEGGVQMPGQAGSGGMSEADGAVMLHRLHMQQRSNNMMNTR